MDRPCSREIISKQIGHFLEGALFFSPIERQVGCKGDTSPRPDGCFWRNAAPSPWGFKISHGACSSGGNVGILGPLCDVFAEAQRSLICVEEADIKFPEIAEKMKTNCMISARATENMIELI